MQRLGVDFFDSSSPTADLVNIRLSLANGARYGLKIDQLDISNAYVNEDSDCDIYVRDSSNSYTLHVHKRLSQKRIYIYVITTIGYKF